MKVCWEKFARYFEVELKEVKLRDDYFVMDPAKAVEMVDENTICVAAILGSTLNGEFEDVKLLNDLLTVKNKETGYYIHLSRSLFSFSECVINACIALLHNNFQFINSCTCFIFILVDGILQSMWMRQAVDSLHHFFTQSLSGISAYRW